ncbi:hypothetical protein GUJ93_ZPchr0009g516 [Zizania palustris]|uniref:Uncharacterized protein n=1 Tax=Zizania palustris TaxID=103762 RepID=A0A8J5VIC5_ZIZPA|nr:hypothetical protein GUJ93_ZPchr0009g516 [Zizania palustris]
MLVRPDLAPSMPVRPDPSLSASLQPSPASLRAWVRRRCWPPSRLGCAAASLPRRRRPPTRLGRGLAGPGRAAASCFLPPCCGCGLAGPRRGVAPAGRRLPALARRCYCGSASGRTLLLGRVPARPLMRSPSMSLRPNATLGLLFPLSLPPRIRLLPQIQVPHSSTSKRPASGTSGRSCQSPLIPRRPPTHAGAIWCSSPSSTMP